MGNLLIRKKSEYKPEEIALLWDNKLAKSKPLHDFLISNPDLNHMRFFWEQTIDYEIVNPECDASWPYPAEVARHRVPKKTIKSLLRDVYLTTRRKMYSQNKRNKKINIYDLLMCPNCTSTSIHVIERAIICNSCASSYPIYGGIPRLFPNIISGFSKVCSK